MAAVLIVDDHVDSSRVLARLIPGHAQPVECVGSAEEALAFIEAHAPPRLIVLDLMMPAMNGIELLQKLRGDERFHHVPIVVFSAFADPTTRRIALAAGAQEFVIKGQVEEAIATVSKYLRATGPGE